MRWRAFGYVVAVGAFILCYCAPKAVCVNSSCSLSLHRSWGIQMEFAVDTETWHEASRSQRISSIFSHHEFTAYTDEKFHPVTGPGRWRIAREDEPGRFVLEMTPIEMGFFDEICNRS